MKSRLKVTFMLLPTAMVWGFAFVAQVLGADHVGPFTFNGIRYLLGATSLCPLLLFLEKERDLSVEWRRQRRKYTARISLFAGAAMFAASALQQYGTTLTRDPAKAGFITGLYTAFTPILYFLIFRKRTAWNTWVGCLLATVGLYLICATEDGLPSFGVGELLLLGGSVIWALHILIIDKYVDSVSPLRFSIYQFTVCGVFGMIFGLLTETVTWDGIWTAKWALLYCGVLSVGVAYTLQIFGQRDADPTHAAIIFSTESVFAAIGGILWNLVAPPHLQVEQRILPIGIVGAVVIIAGIVLSQLRFRPRKSSPANTTLTKGEHP